MLVPRPEVTDERPHPESIEVASAPKHTALITPQDLMTDCTFTLRSA
jgi:hypothetical protein